jgi:hypothetical protein
VISFATLVERQGGVRSFHMPNVRAETIHAVLGSRTIIGKIDGTDRTSVKRGKMRKLELNRAKQASWRTRKRARDGLPKRIAAVKAKGVELLKLAGVSRARCPPRTDSRHRFDTPPAAGSTSIL